MRARLPGSVRLWWEVARRSFRRYATYRAAVVAGLFTNTVFGCVRAYVLLAVFAERPEIGGYDATGHVHVHHPGPHHARYRIVDLAIEEPDIEDVVGRLYTGGGIPSHHD